MSLYPPSVPHPQLFAGALTSPAAETVEKKSESPNAPPLRSAFYSSDDFDHSPFVAFYEVTRACDLLCTHCRACAQPNRHPCELNTQQSKALIQQFASFPKKPVLVFTGGDPMKRADIYDLVEHAKNWGLTTAMTPSATPLLNEQAIRKLQEAGISRLAMSIDGADATTHDAFRGVEGTYRRAYEALEIAREIGLPIQINTTITRRNIHQVDALAAQFASLGIELWSVFFLIPVGRGLLEERIAPQEYEEIFAQLWSHAQTQNYGIKTTEAHHYRRFVLQQHGNPQKQPGGAPRGRIQRAPIGVNDGKGVMFVSHTGTVYPSGFMPLRCGQFPHESIVDIYQRSPLFKQLRDPNRMKGKCGICEFRAVCGGSRARAFAITRDPLAAEPDCTYQPSAWQKLSEEERLAISH